MVADCKSAALRSYGGSNPPLCTRILDLREMQMEQQKKFYVALAVYAVLALLAWIMIDDTPIYVPVPVGLGHGQVVYSALKLSFRQLTWIVLGMFALRTWLHWHAEKVRDERARERQQVSS
jgi:hypothetical protein